LQAYNLFLQRSRSSSSHRLSFFWRRSAEARSLQASFRSALVFPELKKHVKKTPDKNKELEAELKKAIVSLQGMIETHLHAKGPACITMDYLGLPADPTQKTLTP